MKFSKKGHHLDFRRGQNFCFKRKYIKARRKLNIDNERTPSRVELSEHEEKIFITVPAKET